jgi:site-specific recombinase XerC
VGHRRGRGSRESKTFEGRRDEAIIRLFIDSGVRLAEMVGMQVADVDLDGHVARVTGKGKRPRLVGFGDKTARAIDRYLRKRVPDPGPLWIGGKGRLRSRVWPRCSVDVHGG